MALLVLSFSFAPSSAASEHDKHFVVSEPVSIDQFVEISEYWIQDRGGFSFSDRNRSDMVFKPMSSGFFDEDVAGQNVWLRTRVKNGASTQSSWRVFVRKSYLPNYEVYLVRESGVIEHIDSQDPDSAFESRASSFLYLSTSVNIKPGEQIEIYISYKTYGPAKIAVSIETNQSFLTEAANQLSKIYLSYGIFFTLLMASIFGFGVLKIPAFRGYALAVGFFTFWLMHMDGITFKYLWPSHPVFNAKFTVPLGMLSLAAFIVFARHLQQTKEFFPRADKIYLVILALLVLVAGLFFIAPSTFSGKHIAGLFFLSMLVGGGVNIISVGRIKAVAWFYLIAWLGMIVVALLFILESISGLRMWAHIRYDLLRLMLSGAAICIGFGLAWRYRGKLKESYRLKSKGLEDAQEILRLNQHLFSVEEKYNLLGEISAVRERKVKNLAHDFRQPLQALRLTLLSQGAFKGEAEETKGRARGMLTYLEALVSSELKGVVGNDNDERDERIQTKDCLNNDNPFPLDDTLRYVYEMFLPDAAAKGLEFKYVSTTQTTGVPSLIILRIISNLVSNAIKYTPSGRVLLGVRRVCGGLEVQVHDTGIGLTKAEFLWAQERSVRLGMPVELDSVEGNGFGLAIVKQLALDNGLKIRLLANRKNGCGIAVFVPMTGSGAQVLQGKTPITAV